ncbi:uncharacterized protein LOC120687181 [Panicum virgatum]|uniref:DUF4378 domain-containing protein n=1 Tax=Panicum virgatum TaxID=38727 RepID=A0A8T0MXQ8_PANVG|nr:uncharacterized protein LOC120687181 [Panicum virgatum]KAG2539814.1 hypothetical protein PVAP13_9NG496800 [Panicum virgatum]
MAAGAGGAAAPLRLKDLLELDCDSCSAAGFRCYPRRLLGEPPAPATRHLLEPPSLSLRRQRRPSKLSSLSRSLSRRLGSGGGLFWRRRGEDEDAAAAAAAAAPSGSGSESGASSAETATSDGSASAGRRGSRCESDSDLSTAATSAGDEQHEAMKRGSRSRSSSGASEADDKEDQQQLSPVAVMDFPSDDDGDADDAAACSPSFSLARLQRRKMLRPQHKIRRFGNTEELGPVDLEARLAATSDTDDLAGDAPAQRVVIQCRTGDAAAFAPRPSRSHRGAGVVRRDPDEHGLLELLLLMDAGADRVSRRLLLDLFVETKRRRDPRAHPEDLPAAAGLLLLLPPPRKAEWWEDGEVLAAARSWMYGAGSERWGLKDMLRGGEAVLAEMERARRWMRVGEEEREVGAVVAGMLADQLVDEVVWDLLPV